MRRSTRAALALLLVGILAAAVWYHQRRHRHDEVVIGAIFDLTGSLSYMGESSLAGAKLAESEINDSGGVNGQKLRLEVDDAQTRPERAASIFQRYASVRKLPVVIGFNGSSEVMAAAPLAEAFHTVLFSTGAASPGVTGAGDYVFRNRLSGALEAGKMAELAANTLGTKQVAILYIKTDYGRGYADAFKQRFAQLGGTISFDAGFDQDQVDFRGVLTQLSTAPHDVVYLASHAREAGNLLKQASELNIKAKWLASNAVDSPDLFALAGVAADNVLMSVARYDPKDPSTKAFNGAYHKVYGRDSDMFAAHAYDAVRIVAQILKTTGGDPQKVKTALYEVRNYPGVSGVTTFDKNGDVLKDVVFKVARAGKFENIDEGQIRKLWLSTSLPQPNE